MDRPVDPLFRRQRLIKGIGLTVGILIVVITGLTALFGWISPSVRRNEIRIARVERGAIEATLTASGTVVPEFEQVLSSSIDTRVLKVLHKPGDLLTEGQPVLALDTGSVRIALETLDDQIALNKNKQDQLHLDLEKTLNTLRSQREIKQLQVAFYQGKSERTQKMQAEGLVAETELRQARLEEEIAAVELQQLDEAIRNTARTAETQIEGLALELSILRKNRMEAAKQLRLATPTADRDGVLTWVVSEEGATVRQGEIIARIANLNSFRVRGMVSDIHAGRIAAGMPVKVLIGDAPLTGSITNILPTIENGIVHLDIRLDDSRNPRLKSNLRVDVYIVTAYKDHALRVARGPFASVDGEREVFVIHGDVAVKQRVQFGLAGFEYFEVVDGLQEGDEVIVSSMESFMHMDEVTVR